MYCFLVCGGWVWHCPLFLGSFGLFLGKGIARTACFYVMSIAVVLDILGDQLGVWHYRYHVIPVLPTYFPWDITLMPLAILVLLQIKPAINPWYKSIFFALLSSYGGEPFFDWLGVYVPTNWRYSYSVPIQIAIYMSAYYLSRRNNFTRISHNK
jgi:hypothetical protein